MRISATRTTRFFPVALAMSYSFLVKAFHSAVTPPAGQLGTLHLLAATLLFLGMLATPVLGLVCASLPGHTALSRRLAFASVTTPTAFVLLGVVQALLGSSIPDEWIWCSLWASAAVLLVTYPDEESSPPTPKLVRLRVAHGLAGAIVLVYATFHVINHLFSLVGPEAYNNVMTAGGRIYRSAIVEPILITAMLFQVCSGICLMWRWSAVHADVYRVIQIGSGVYLAIFILGHMNSVFIYARGHLGIPTDWAFASGGTNGLLLDAWNIRLLPHYALGVLLLVVHVISGIRVVLIAHNVRPVIANRLWKAGVLIGLMVTAAVTAGLAGVRL